MGYSTLSFLVFLVSAICKSQEMEKVVAVSGRNVELPCYMLPADPNDRAILALWYKQGRRLPVYSYDARDSESEHHLDNSIVKNRAKFLANVSPPRLILDPVKSADSGIYTCRVDFFTSPTHNTIVNLTIIDPPEDMIIVDANGQTVTTKTTPINEGSPLFLSCVVSGGRPPPNVTWWTASMRIESAVTYGTLNKVQSDLTVLEVTRSMNTKGYTCRSENNVLEKPLSQTVILEMNLRPLNVAVKLPKGKLKAGTQYSFQCESKGSRPTATVTWYLDGSQIDTENTHVKNGPDEMTIGVLVYTPNATDHRKQLKCQAENPAIAGSAITNELTLNINYPPRVQLKMGHRLKPSEIKQGDDVYFDCGVYSNPRPYKISWYRNGDLVAQNKSIGIIVQENSLVLQNLRRTNTGEYTCQAFNTYGNQVSNSVILGIMFAPECAMEAQPTVLAVGRGETINITCRIATNPLKTTFRWQLNGSERTYDSQGIPYSDGEVVSHYTFVGTVDKDYGSLLCWANNTVGVQERACIFNIIPAGPPSTPENCELLLNHTTDTIDVFCDHGFDGGLSQKFLAEVYDEGGTLHGNITSNEPIFYVESLRPDTNYVIKVLSYNEKGRSPPVHLTAYTLKVAEKRMGETESILYSPLIIIFLSILGAFLFLIMLLILVTRWRKSMTATLLSDSSRLPEKLLTSPAILEETKPLNTIGENPLAEMEVADKVKVKPKKTVLVVENGKIEKPGLTSPTSEKCPTKESMKTSRNREIDYDSRPPDYYSSYNNPRSSTQSVNYHSMLLNSYITPNTSPKQHYPTTHNRTLPQPVITSRSKALSPLLEESSSYYQQHYSTLPRKGPPDSWNGPSHNYRDGGRVGSVEDRYHLEPELKSNPKYLIRTRDREIDDESFV